MFIVQQRTGVLPFLQGSCYQSLFSSLKAGHHLENRAVWKVLEWKREVAFLDCGGHPATYAREMFLLMVTPQNIAEWRGLVGYRGGQNTFALLLNLKSQLEFLLHQKFAELYLQDWEAIREEIDYILR